MFVDWLINFLNKLLDCLDKKNTILRQTSNPVLDSVYRLNLTLFKLNRALKTTRGFNFEPVGLFVYNGLFNSVTLTVREVNGFVGFDLLVNSVLIYSFTRIVFGLGLNISNCVLFEGLQELGISVADYKSFSDSLSDYLLDSIYFF
jgi:hypothetical protein